MLELLGYGSIALASGLVAGLEHRVEAEQPQILSTRLTREYGLSFPFVGAGMGFVALPELVAAVSNAGGLGVLGVAPEPPPAVGIRIGQIRALTDKPFGIDFFLTVASPPIGPVTVDAHIDAVLAAKGDGAPIQVVVFHFDTPKPEWVRALQSAGIKVWAQVPSVEDARAAVEVGVDALIAQGKEAGGHSKSTTPLKQLLRDLISAVDPNILVLAAGGIATGADLVEALAHGAEGVWVGTRLVASTEAYAHPEWKQRLVDARKQDTVKTLLFGPELPCKPYRVLRTQVVDQFLPVEKEICGTPPDFNPPIGTTTLFPGTPFAVSGVPMPKFSALPPTPDTVPLAGNLEAFGMPAGEGVQQINDIKPVAQIITEMMAQAREIISDQLQRRRQ
jgi:enoyl-[acyl-carrier protein] reductase II